MRYGVQGSESIQTIKIPGGAATQHTISELKCTSNYAIEVAGMNSAGTGVYSNSIFAITEGILFQRTFYCDYYKYVILIVNTYC